MINHSSVQYLVIYNKNLSRSSCNAQTCLFRFIPVCKNAENQWCTDVLLGSMCTKASLIFKKKNQQPFLGFGRQNYRFNYKLTLLTSLYACTDASSDFEVFLLSIFQFFLITGHQLCDYLATCLGLKALKESYQLDQFTFLFRRQKPKNLPNWFTPNF